MPRSIWKGSISFGLVQVPVGLYSAENRTDVSFQLIDSRNKGRVRYHRVNEDTGKEVPWSSIVKGYEYEDDKYVLFTDDELKKVQAEATQTIEIESFLEIEEVDPIYFDKPYYLVPDKKVRSAAKSYALLREALRKTGKVGLARVVIRTREYLCLLMVRDKMLVLELVRFPQEVHETSGFDLPGDDLSKLKISAKEIEMATELVGALAAEWNPKDYHDTHREALMDWIESKIEKRDVEVGDAGDGAPAKGGGKVIDLMDHLKKSVEAAKRGGPTKSVKKRTKSSGGSAKKKAAKKRSPAKKAARKRKAG